MKILALLVCFATLAVVIADRSTDEERRYLNKWQKQADDYNRKHPKGDPKPDDVEFVDEFPDGIKRRRRDTNGNNHLIRKERSISREGSMMKINLVSFHKPGETRRVKRATYNVTSTNWPHRIPFVFNASYPQALRPKVRRIMKYLMDHLCVTWVEEPSFDPTNNTYDTNSYLHFVGSDSNACLAFVGQGSGNSARTIQTCSSYYTITHEILHTLGSIHEQQGPLSADHVSLALQNIQPGKFGGTYRRVTTLHNLVTSEFDTTSIMMYSRNAFTRNGLNIVMAYRRDELDLNYNMRTSLANNLQELNNVYKCRERHCSDNDVDCGQGYYSFVKGQCVCVCPDGFDPAHNCQQLDTENSGPTEWPDVGFSMYAYQKNDCPDGFSHGAFNITGTRGATDFYVPFPKSGRTTNYYMCTRDSAGADMDRMPMGSYCVIKPVGHDCNGAFSQSGYVVETMENFTHAGDYGDWEIQSDNPMKVDMKFCCRRDKETQYSMELPRKKGFMLVAESGYCPTIEGMRYGLGLIVMFVPGSTRYNNPPRSWLQSYYLIHGFCKYRPGVYGCNEQVTLNSDHRSQTFKTPGFDSGQREQDKRCLYHFTVPKGARIKVTMDVFDVDGDDLFNIRRFHKWALPQLDFAKHFKKEFISQKDFLFLEWWAGEKAKSGKKGVQFTAEVLLEEDSCHHTKEGRGRNYIGTKNVTENFEECLPWKDAAACEDFPFLGPRALEMLSHNYCRNPGGAMERPWCYVSVNRMMCRRAYCDVCNKLDRLDQLPNCTGLLTSDPDLCKNTLQRMKCAKTCDFDTNVPPPDIAGAITCGTPWVPFDGAPTSDLKTGYTIGEIVSFTCTTRGGYVDIECTSAGWPVLKSACSQCPPGWIPYGDRCFLFDPQYRLVDKAEEFCQSQNGRMFEIRSAEDLQTLRNFKQTSSVDGAWGSTWVNIQLRSNGNWTLYDNDTVNAPLVDWSDNCVLNDIVNHGCVVMIYEKDNTGNAGKFNTTSCNLGASRTFCEMHRVIPPAANCSDQSGSCVSALTNDPDFCQRTNSYEVASTYCQKSCGECAADDHEQCTDPQKSTYTRTSENDVINMGDVMEFACNSGLYLVKGSLKRVCGHGGKFLGIEPVCTDTPTEPVRVGIEGVIEQNDKMPTNKILLLDDQENRIPFNGVVTQWHFFGVKIGVVNFVIYRHNSTSGKYRMLGYNPVSIATVYERWTHQVDAIHRIEVQEGDIFGMFTIDGNVAATSCGSRMDAIMTLKTEISNSIDDTMIGTEKPFSGTACYAPSIGLTVHP